MAYIIKNTSGLINTRLTDVGRRKLSQGNFNIRYFQVGDSEVNYTAVPNYNQTNNNILMPAFDAQNNVGHPQSNKQNIKYPYYVSSSQGNTYGLPYNDSKVDLVYNSAGIKGFFTGTTGSWIAQTSSGYTISSNYVVNLSTIDGDNLITIEDSFCSTSNRVPNIGDLITIYYDFTGSASCGNVGTYPILTYRIQDIDYVSSGITLDRSTPNYASFSGLEVRCLIYPSGMTVIYDTVTPAPYWQTDTLNFESPCDVSNRENTLIWNMNIPWSESPAGLRSSIYEDYTSYGSVSYIGTKEYLGYQENSGQTDNTQTYYYNSFNEKIVLSPSDQKAIAIIHYTNQDIDHIYGEKFATQPFDPQNPTDDIGLARNLKVTIPTLMWHKSTGSTIGETFYIDPPGYDLCYPYYMESAVNPDMNEPGLRYYQLWDLNPNSNGELNRVGKVFPDQQIIVIDDEEIIAAMSYKSNRNWTLPAPKVSLIVPNACSNTNTTGVGCLINPGQKLWVSYILTGVTNSIHCNYYSVVSGPQTGSTSQDVSVRLGNEFPFLSNNGITGFSNTSMALICQFVSGDTRPNPSNWKLIDVTSQVSSGGYLTVSGITGTTFQITENIYQNAPYYYLNDFISIPTNGEPNVLNFGDEYYFYGNFETDIAATIYEMRYLINLNQNQFTNTTNPTWISGTTSYISEIGLYDENKDLIVISKLQSPQLRQGIQQYVVKLDF